MSCVHGTFPRQLEVSCVLKWTFVQGSFVLLVVDVLSHDNMGFSAYPFPGGPMFLPALGVHCLLGRPGGQGLP